MKIRYTDNARLSSTEQHRQLNLLQAINCERLAADGGDNPPLEGIIQSYETAFRMQSEMADLAAIDKAPQHVLDCHGIGDVKITDNFGRACLMARRFSESGVRFIQLNHGFWDHHKDLAGGMKKRADQTDQPISALLTDLNKRTWFTRSHPRSLGRPPILNKNKGCDHTPDGFTMWMAGSGSKGGTRFNQLGAKTWVVFGRKNGRVQGVFISCKAMF